MNILPFRPADTHRYRLLVAAHFKLFVIFLTVLISLFSGSAQAADSRTGEAVFVKQLNAIVVSSQAGQTFSRDNAKVRQVMASAVTAKKSSPPKISPTPVQADSKSAINEEKPATAAESLNQPSNPFFTALNTYRQKNGKALLSWDGKLAGYAQERADLYNKQGGLDHHSGFNEFIHNQDGFKKLGFYSLGENSGYGHSADPSSIIENSYGNSPTHNENQLSTNWSHVGIGISGSATNFVFGGSKM